MSKIWEEIHGFQFPEEYKRFLNYIEAQVEVGVAKELPPAPGYRKGQIFGGRWFEALETGEVWRLVPPDFPFTGLWERVDQ